MDLINLTQLSYKQKAIIRNFDESELYIKLMEMGCIPDEQISVELVAPLGDPLSIMVAGYNLSIRKSDAEKIMVEIM
jgi:ferrous iron transport protein A